MDIDGIWVEELLPAAFEGASYVYDGDGNLVKSEVNGVVTYYLGKYYEKTVQNGHYAEKKHYSAGSSMIAVRTVIDGTQDTLNWLVGDHLGSTSLVTDSTGAVVNEIRYSAFGEMRYLNGETVTDLLYTGQKLDSYINLYWYSSRWYDPYLNRFLSPDSIIPDPGNTGAYDRYAYVENNPLNNTDPIGHKKVPGGPGGVIIVYDGDNDVSDPTRYYYNMYFYGSVGGSGCTEEEVKDVTLNLLSIAFDPVDYYLTYKDIQENGFHWYHGFALAPIVPLGISKIAGKHLDDVVVIAKRSLEDFIKLDGVKLPVDEALDTAIDFLGDGYKDLGGGRFSNEVGENIHQVRMLDVDFAGHNSGLPHINLEVMEKIENRPGRYNVLHNIHIFFDEVFK